MSLALYLSRVRSNEVLDGMLRTSLRTTSSFLSQQHISNGSGHARKYVAHRRTLCAWQHEPNQPQNGPFMPGSRHHVSIVALPDAVISTITASCVSAWEAANPSIQHFPPRSTKLLAQGPIERLVNRR